jgi:hypothetical protein
MIRSQYETLHLAAQRMVDHLPMTPFQPLRRDTAIGRVR